MNKIILTLVLAYLLNSNNKSSNLDSKNNLFLLEVNPETSTVPKDILTNDSENLTITTFEALEHDVQEHYCDNAKDRTFLDYLGLFFIVVLLQIAYFFVIWVAMESFITIKELLRPLLILLREEAAHTMHIIKRAYPNYSIVTQTVIFVKRMAETIFFNPITKRLGQIKRLLYQERLFGFTAVFESLITIVSALVTMIVLTKLLTLIALVGLPINFIITILEFLNSISLLLLVMVIKYLFRLTVLPMFIFLIFCIVEYCSKISMKVVLWYNAVKLRLEILFLRFFNLDTMSKELQYAQLIYLINRHFREDYLEFNNFSSKRFFENMCFYINYKYFAFQIKANPFITILHLVDGFIRILFKIEPEDYVFISIGRSYSTFREFGDQDQRRSLLIYL